MDPFTQRMLERARARQEKIDQKLASSGQAVPKRRPLADSNISPESPTKTPAKTSRSSISSPKIPFTETGKSTTPSKVTNRRSSTQKSDQIRPSPQKQRSDVVVTKKEFVSPKKGSVTRRNSDVSVEINISHRNDIQIEVQVEERDAPISVVYDSLGGRGNNVIIKEIEDSNSDNKEDASSKMDEIKESESRERTGLRHTVKSRLDRLGNLYSDNPHLSSPIHRTEQEFTAGTPPRRQPEEPENDKRGKKFGRLAALADQINNWEDDLTHHNFQPEPSKKTITKPDYCKDKDASTLDVSIHSITDINRALHSNAKAKQTKTINSTTFKKPTNECQRLGKQIVAELEGEGYRRVSASQSRLVYDFTSTKADPARQEPKRASTTPSATSAPNMATMVAAGPIAPVTKKPSLKKYKAPTPPAQSKLSDDSDSDKDKENNVVPVKQEENANDVGDCKQTKPEPVDKGSPIVKRLAPKLNGNVDRSSVLSKAAMFEAGSPRAKDPAEMSLRERKALFEKNKGAAIIPKAPFGLAPSVKTLHGDKDTKSTKPLIQPKPVPPTKSSTSSNSTNSTPTRSNSNEEIPDDNISQSSLGGGIKGKLAALFSKEQTISETTIANKFKLEREREMEMLQNRFHYKPPPQKPADSDDESDSEPSDKAPLMRSTTSLNNANKKPEIVANVPKVTFEKTDEKKDDVISQSVKRRSSQDSPVVLAVVDDVKRIKVNEKDAQNGAISQQPRLYPHLSDIETDHTASEEYSDCGGSVEDLPRKLREHEDLNKSDNWAETSFGREVMNVVKKNNSSYRKAVRESDSDSSGDASAGDSELDDMLDEALAEESEGPTPPKLNKNGQSSTSFEYQQQSQFKSPLKTQPEPSTPSHRDKGNELVHSVSFYRRMQSASSTPSTPMRVVRHCSPERETPTLEDASANVTTVRQRIKELQSEITKQQTVISQASQALNLCAATIEFSGSTEQAEGERLLLLASHRRAACVQELQRLQVEGAGPAAAAGAAELHLQGLVVPLRREYVRKLNADGAVGHHVVCLVKCRDRVLASSMQLTQPAAARVTFPDQVHMLGVSGDFKVTVEVYLLQASKEVLPHNVKYHIFNKKTSSKLLTPKSKSSSLKTPVVQSPAGPLAVRSPQFQLHGYCIFALPQANRKNFTLNKVPGGSPLEGSVSLDIKARVTLPAPAPHAAFLTAFDEVCGLGAWHRRWFRLQPPSLTYWKYPDDVTRKAPIGDIDLSTVVSEQATRAPRDLCARPHTILLETTVPAGLVVPDTGSLVYTRRGDQTLRRHLLAADTAAERDAWLQTINCAIRYVRCQPSDTD